MLHRSKMLVKQKYLGFLEGKVWSCSKKKGGRCCAPVSKDLEERFEERSLEVSRILESFWHGEIQRLVNEVGEAKILCVEAGGQC